MFYEYKCKSCGTTHHRTSREPPASCDVCGEASIRRVWGFQMMPVMHEHRSSVTGTVVSDRSHLQRDLDVAAAKQSERLGYDQKYAIVDPTDTKALRVSAAELGPTMDTKTPQQRKQIEDAL
jgi:putative FmdB family regulatory protein